MKGKLLGRLWAAGEGSLAQADHLAPSEHAVRIDVARNVLAVAARFEDR
jgi:hypothetical protein